MRKYIYDYTIEYLSEAGNGWIYFKAYKSLQAAKNRFQELKTLKLRTSIRLTARTYERETVKVYEVYDI